MSNLAKANRLLDKTCKRAGIDPVELRLAMIQTLQAKLQNGKGYERLPPTEAFVPADGETIKGVGTFRKEQT